MRVIATGAALLAHSFASRFPTHHMTLNRRLGLCPTTAVAFGLTVAMGSTFAAVDGRAATITNVDTRAHKIIIIEGDEAEELELGIDEQVVDACPEGCVLQLEANDDEEFELTATDSVVIEDNSLFYETDADEALESTPDATPAE